MSKKRLELQVGDRRNWGNDLIVCNDNLLMIVKEDGLRTV